MASIPVLLVAAFGAIALVLFGRVPGEALWAADVNNFAHGPVFAILTLIMVALLRRVATRETRPIVEYPLALVAVVLLGAVIEIAQARIGRDAQAGDVLRDALGALAALGFLAVFDRKIAISTYARGLRIGGLLVGLVATAALLAPLAVAAGAYRQRSGEFPELADFGRPFSTYFVAAVGDVDIQREALPPGLSGEAGRVVGLHVQPSGGRWWGVVLREPKADWGEFDYLALAIANPASVPLRLRVRIHDGRHRPGEPTPFVARITVEPRSSGIARIALQRPETAGSAPALDIGDVSSLMIARAGTDRAPGFYLLRTWLE